MSLPNVAGGPTATDGNRNSDAGDWLKQVAYGKPTVHVTYLINLSVFFKKNMTN
ncbi:MULTISPECIES: hypothetical protein [unclassified Lentimonas]|nr:MULTISPECIES: hypothetical protein [unclassified Lentimonas]CAA7182011.1 Unannotated [Lentimonas sp. CC8]CAA6677232.1 Unannotated [Lentimonas sp. CC4]CAA6686143.1 Unannotated [Lentimonas sp. CC6]CAA7074175.1 Unannotated [Lentimonas sp. CC4]CAA7171533.1 Unannotated [Lentimonas sp. CC21]